MDGACIFYHISCVAMNALDLHIKKGSAAVGAEAPIWARRDLSHVPAQPWSAKHSPGILGGGEALCGAAAVFMLS